MNKVIKSMNNSGPKKNGGAGDGKEGRKKKRIEVIGCKCDPSSSAKTN